MKKCVIYIQIFYFILIEVSCRKYDLESEAMKLYGEDFETVLKRFRKTPDYLMVLTDKMKELNDNKENIGMMTMYHYIEKLNKKIADVLGLERDRTDLSTTTPHPPTNYFRGHFTYRRQEAIDSAERFSPVRKLESYPRLSSALSVSERNSFMDLGFEYAGHIIHTMIKSMGPDDEPVKSTRLPFGGNHHHDTKLTTTTEHVHVHEVKPTDTVMDSTAATESVTTPISRYRYKPQRP